MKTIIALMLVGILAGCASSPPQAGHVKPGTMLENPWTTQAPGTGSLTITRDPHFVGMGCTARAYLDGTAIADLRVSQAVTVYPGPGEHVAGVKLCGSDDEKSLMIVEGETKRFRIAVGVSGEFKIEPTAF